MNDLNMDDEKLHFRHVISYGFRKGEAAEMHPPKTPRKFIWTVLSLFERSENGRFLEGDFNINHQPRPERLSSDGVCHGGE